MEWVILLSAVLVLITACVVAIRQGAADRQLLRDVFKAQGKQVSEMLDTLLLAVNPEAAQYRDAMRNEQPDEEPSEPKPPRVIR